jgi:hypothetical protein
MRQRIVRIAPMPAAKVAAVVYGIVAIVFIPFFILPRLLGAANAPPLWLPLVLIPLYVGAGFLMTALMAWLYNVVARWVGGLEITLETGVQNE